MVLPGAYSISGSSASQLIIVNLRWVRFMHSTIKGGNGSGMQWVRGGRGFPIVNEHLKFGALLELDDTSITLFAKNLQGRNQFGCEAVPINMTRRVSCTQAVHSRTVHSRTL